MNQFIQFDPAGAGTRSYGGVILNVDMIAGPVVQDFPAGNGDEYLGIPLRSGKNAFMLLEYFDAAAATSAKQQLDAAIFNSNPGVGTLEITGACASIEFSS
jgi:hypothetical protein